MALRLSSLQARFATSPVLGTTLILIGVVALMLAATAAFGVSPFERPDVLTVDPAGQLPF